MEQRKIVRRGKRKKSILGNLQQRHVGKDAKMFVLICHTVGRTILEKYPLCGPYLKERMTHSGVPLHRYGHGEVGGPRQHHLAGGQHQGEQVVVGLEGPDAVNRFG